MNIFIRIVVPILLLLAGVVSMVVLASSATEEEKVDIIPPEISVKIQSVNITPQRIKVHSSGVVRASQTVNIVPQVGGKIVSIADSLQPGRRFQKGETIANIDPEDYRLNLEQDKSRVQQAQVELQVEEKRQEAAQREWALLGNDGEAPLLASRKPQLEVARLALAAAKAAQNRSELSLSRTRLVAPFNGIIKSEQLEIGQVVGVGAPVATLLGTDQYWVRVSVPAARLKDIDIPDVGVETGSKVLLVYRPSSEVMVEKVGVVLRLEAELDPQSRTATLLIGVDNPLGGDEFPLIIGAFVNVIIDGKQVDNAVQLPASALRDGDHVLVADKENKLARKDVQVGWTDGENVFITGGLESGDRVITSTISTPIYGTSLRIESLEE
ncbi:MAG: efflux RND transporter periplasmic adaptor subunit [Myxococcota bacterium]|nr:efflux RND transporter periplasmic adaptor subunit [Myxococcota bacterium]